MKGAHLETNLALDESLPLRTPMDRFLNGGFPFKQVFVITNGQVILKGKEGDNIT